MRNLLILDHLQLFELVQSEFIENEHTNIQEDNELSLLADLINCWMYILNDKFFVHQRNGRQLNNARSATFHRSFIDFLVFIGKLISSGRDPHLYVILTLSESCGVARHCLWDIFRTQNSWCSVYILFIESTYIFYRPSIFCISRLICYFWPYITILLFPLNV